MPRVIKHLATLKGLLRLLSTNEPPSASEEAEIRAFLDYLQSSQEGPENGHSGDALHPPNSMTKRIESVKAILSPIRRLPGEIIGEILLHALEHYGPGKPTAATLDTTIGPWAFTHICRVWRDVVISFPRLWSFWQLDEETIRTCDTSRSQALKIMGVIVHRSKREPLTVALRDGVFDDDHGDRTDLRFTSRIMQVVLRECHRWKHVDICCDRFRSLAALNAIKGNLGALESLKVRVCRDAEREDRRSEHSYDEDEPSDNDYYQRPPPRPHVVKTFKVAPRLRHVVLDIDDEHTPTVKLLLPWEQLTRYEESDNQGGAESQHMKMWNRLINVVDSELCYASVPRPIKTYITLPRIRTLKTRNASVLEFLTLPSLETLHIMVPVGYAFGNDSFGHLRPLDPFFIRSHCNLQELSIVYPDKEYVVEMLSLVSSLTILTIHDGAYDDNLINALVLRPGSNPLLPLLTQLKMTMGTDSDLAKVEQPVIEMIHSRWNVNGGTRLDCHWARLRLFTFDICSRFGGYDSPGRRFSADFKDVCRGLRQEGLELVVRDTRGPA